MAGVNPYFKANNVYVRKSSNKKGNSLNNNKIKAKTLFRRSVHTLLEKRERKSSFANLHEFLCKILNNYSIVW